MKEEQKFVTINGENYLLSFPEKLPLPKFFNFKSFIKNAKLPLTWGQTFLGFGSMTTAAFSGNIPLFVLGSAIAATGTAITLLNMKTKDPEDRFCKEMKVEESEYFRQYVSRILNQLGKLETKKNHAKSIDRKEYFAESQEFLINDFINTVVNNYAQVHLKNIDVLKDYYEECSRIVKNQNEFDNEEVELAKTLIYKIIQIRADIDIQLDYINDVLVNNISLFSNCQPQVMNKLPQLLRTKSDTIKIDITLDEFLKSLMKEGNIKKAIEVQLDYDYYKTAFRFELESDRELNNIFGMTPLNYIEGKSNEKTDEIEKYVEIIEDKCSSLPKHNENYSQKSKEVRKTSEDLKKIIDEDRLSFLKK